MKKGKNNEKERKKPREKETKKQKMETNYYPLKNKERNWGQNQK